MRKNDAPSSRHALDGGLSLEIGYVSLNVSDLDHSLDFYQNILGFKRIATDGGRKALLSADGSPSHLLELSQVNSRIGDNGSGAPLGAKKAGLYHFAVVLPERKYLADMLQSLRDTRDRVHFDGLADHLVSESIYIRDPDLIGIEIYSDRPMSLWTRDGNKIALATLPLNTNDLLREATQEGWKKMPPKTRMGHVHLHVSDIRKATRFYQEILGLHLTSTIPSAAFFAAGNYHHHIAANTWLGTDILPAAPGSVGLNHFSIMLPTKEVHESLMQGLSRYGVEMSEPDQTSVFVKDMDGIRVKIQHK